MVVLFTYDSNQLINYVPYEKTFVNHSQKLLGCQFFQHFMNQVPPVLDVPLVLHKF